MDGRLDKCSSRASEQRLDSYHARAAVAMLGLKLPNSQDKTKLAASIYPDPLAHFVRCGAYVMIWN